MKNYMGVHTRMLKRTCTCNCPGGLSVSVGAKVLKEIRASGGNHFTRGSKISIRDRCLHGHFPSVPFLSHPSPFCPCPHQCPVRAPCSYIQPELFGGLQQPPVWAARPAASAPPPSGRPPGRPPPAPICPSFFLLCRAGQECGWLMPRLGARE